jgi:hypothetical protein
MLIIGIMLAVLFVFATIVCQDVYDAVERMARITLFVLVVPFAILYFFVIPYKGKPYIEENF